MKLFPILASIMFFPPPYGDDRDEMPIADTPEFKQRCKSESEKYLQENHSEPFNWTASWYTSENILIVEGNWRVNSGEVNVICKIRNGDKRKNAVFEILEEEPPPHNKP